MRLNKEKVINQEKMNESSLSHHQTHPSQWDVIMLKDEKCCTALNLSWTDYFTSCHKLIYLTLDNASHIYLNLTFHTKLEGLFLGYGAYVDPPSSMKIFVLYTSKEKYQKHKNQLSGTHGKFLMLGAPKYLSDPPKPCTELKLW
jgi:hypothetical protein